MLVLVGLSVLVSAVRKRNVIWCESVVVVVVGVLWWWLVA